METESCFQALTIRLKRRSSKTVCDRELPCLVRNVEDDDVDVPTNEEQTKRGSEEINQELAEDSTGDFHVKSSLKFIPSTYKNDGMETKCWKIPQMYNVPTIPPTIWKIIAKLLGIPLHPGDKPYLATFLHVLTFASSLCYIILSVWLDIRDVAMKNSGRTVLKRTVETVIFTSFALLTVYANKLAYRMLTHQSFVKYVKMHSKTILKCKAAHLMSFMAFLFFGLNVYESYYRFHAGQCNSIKLAPVVCIITLISRIVSLIFSFIWNLMIAILILSVCRTHCLEIRQFIKELEKDAIAHDEMRRRTFSTSTISSNLMDDAIDIEDIDDSNSSSDEKEMDNFNDRTSIPAIYVVSSDKNITNEHVQIVEPRHNSRRNEYSDHFLKPNDILHCYWKLQCSLRLTSSAFKRWLVCYMLICVMWLAICLIGWLSQPPTPLSFGMFIVPLLCFGILSSAIAEVNNEGVRTLRFLCPNKERLKMLIYLNEAPLQMAIYGFSVKYSSLVTSVIGLVVALMSGVVLQEVKSL